MTGEQPTAETALSPIRRISGYHWLVFVIASAGWVFDVYEGQLFSIFKTPALAEVLGYSAAEITPDSAVSRAIEWHGNVALALFLVGGAIGGLGFGMLGDRIGRVRTMALTILTYSAFSALTAFAQTAWQIDALRFLVALGTGGEWAVAAALIAETFPGRSRALAGAAFHATSVAGGALAAVTGMILTQPGDWRTGFLIGLVPALLTLLIRMSLREPEGWVEARRRPGTGCRVGFRGSIRQPR